MSNNFVDPIIINVVDNWVYVGDTTSIVTEFVRSGFDTITTQQGWTKECFATTENELNAKIQAEIKAAGNGVTTSVSGTTTTTFGLKATITFSQTVTTQKEYEITQDYKYFYHKYTLGSVSSKLVFFNKVKIGNQNKRYL